MEEHAGDKKKAPVRRIFMMPPYLLLSLLAFPALVVLFSMAFSGGRATVLRDMAALAGFFAILLGLPLVASSDPRLLRGQKRTVMILVFGSLVPLAAFIPNMVDNLGRYESAAEQEVIPEIHDAFAKAPPSEVFRSKELKPLLRSLSYWQPTVTEREAAACTLSFRTYHQCTVQCEAAEGDTWTYTIRAISTGEKPLACYYSDETRVIHYTIDGTPPGPESPAINEVESRDT